MSNPKPPKYNNHIRNGIIEVGDTVRVCYESKHNPLAVVMGWEFYCDMHRRLNIFSPVVRLQEGEPAFLCGKRELTVPSMILSVVKEGVEPKEINWQEYYKYAPVSTT